MPSPPPAAPSALAVRIDAALPQTQCTRCGYPDCAAYAHAIAEHGVPINQCPPGGAEGIARLAAITGQPVLPLSAEHGTEAPRAVVFIDEAWCIGCTLCIKACPTDAIVGTHKKMHTVIEPYCTGCELCVHVCPVDCIHMENISGAATGWSAWSAPLAQQARQRYQAHRERLPLEAVVEDKDFPEINGAAMPTIASADHNPSTSLIRGEEDKAQALRQAAIAAALERARQRRAQNPR
ncbi:electron transport complex subunit RsxB [Acidovorax sp. sif0715]|nr:electron transport complex subunit RsxB [Acidovorax sp. sif0732]MBV7447772.1 electron transport complex subunit RsxB [Acidovorax sp. sif0715]